MKLGLRITVNGGIDPAKNIVARFSGELLLVCLSIFIGLYKAIILICSKQIAQITRLPMMIFYNINISPHDAIIL